MTKRIPVCWRDDFVGLSGLLTGLGQGRQYPLAILDIGEDGFASIAPVHDVVNGTRILDS